MACIKIGAIYTNIDIENPKIRLEKMFNICEPKLLVCDHKPSTLISSLSNKLNIDLLDLSEIKLYESFDDGNLEVSKGIIGSTPAYIMFTSGSTVLQRSSNFTCKHIKFFRVEHKQLSDNE